MLRQQSLVHWRSGERTKNTGCNRLSKEVSRHTVEHNGRLFVKAIERREGELVVLLNLDVQDAAGPKCYTRLNRTVDQWHGFIGERQSDVVLGRPSRRSFQNR